MSVTYTNAGRKMTCYCVFRHPWYLLFVWSFTELGRQMGIFFVTAMQIIATLLDAL